LEIQKTTGFTYENSYDNINNINNINNFNSYMNYNNNHINNSNINNKDKIKISNLSLSSNKFNNLKNIGRSEKYIVNTSKYFFLII
jgi:hypothetical protein